MLTLAFPLVVVTEGYHIARVNLWFVVLLFDEFCSVLNAFSTTVN